MVERTQPNFDQMAARLRDEPQGADGRQRRQMVAAVADALLCRETPHDGALLALLETLVADSDWSVRLEVARMAHLLGEEACGRLVARLRTDCNSYVRKHAERSLARQRRQRQSSNGKRSQCRGYAEQLDQLARQYGKSVASKVQALADQRYAILASSVAHDVRSILTTLSANAAALAAELGHSVRIASVLEDISFLKRTVEAMEMFSRPEPLQRHPEDLKEVIGQAVDKAREALAQQGHETSGVEVVVADGPAITMRIARRLIVLALTNVIQNALESFADRDVDALRPGRIDVRLIVEGYEMRIVVSDDGPGIEPPVLQELRGFVPTGPNKSKRSSSGWGLSLVHKYVTAHGGAVTIDSQTDRGTTVVLMLPMRQAPEE